ncbi:MAG: YeeE/YedE family protein [Bradyrhizobium sp.]|nr:MAG: YeeE/YedE family protein [Bradyrhizobium sp.]
MTIDWAHFAPLSALAGGALIGVAAAFLILGAGRILGAAGIVGGALDIGSVEAPWRWSLIAGLVVSPLIARSLSDIAAPVFLVHWPALIVSGLLVGFGARLGSGCTSGHGVCGLARLSPRSAVATVVFMATAVVTVFITHHLIG